ncbi:hypothetical protein FZEAL_6586 [Fusarium zealandicum]|uniref:Alpha N-terminal protein methyltransferase 1 n=1 Tax=Fusarium zealandicum TaxID=1053134 RepID=A0A8H4UI95_9HYPO|nr:hypothetical protein FZEAL_6586 [Fusarium zealandicum]
MARRHGSHEGAGCPPSWTWAGWKGSTENYAWTAACYMKNQPFNWRRADREPFQVIPMLTWYTKDSKDSPEQPIPFQNEWYDYKVRFMGKADDLPHGWEVRPEVPAVEPDEEVTTSSRTFKEDPECQVAQRGLQTPYFYEHESCPGIRFWHPVPIGSSDVKAEFEANSYGRYLCAKTNQARLWGAKPHWDDSIRRAVSYQSPDELVVTMFGPHHGVSAMITNEDGEETGELSAETQDDVDRIWATEGSGLPTDVVAVSRGLQFPDPQVIEKETWSFYNVLWVEWEDGIAYRKGVGVVKRNTKDESAPDSLISMDAGKKYWESVEASVTGMLGGIPAVTRVDLQGSRTFLARLGIGVKTGRSTVPRALEGGAGIGRVTEGLLLQVAEQVDVIEPVAKFTAALEGKAGVGSIFNVGLEDWAPEDGVAYDLIWTQWCVGQLPDDLLVDYFERCKAALSPGGVMVLKENLSTNGADEFDELDHSVTR